MRHRTTYSSYSEDNYPSPNDPLTRGEKLFCIFITALAIAGIALALLTDNAMAHHGKPGETQQLARSRDAFYVNTCDRTVKDGISPSREHCKAVLRATHTISYQGRRATRAWVTSNSSLWLLRRESSYRHRAVNPSSGACGMGQMLPCQKFGPQFPCWSSLQFQANCYVRYVLGRYRTPARAWEFWLNNHWY